MTLHLFVRLETGGNTAEVGRALAECGPPSRAEAGCIEYRSFRGEDGRSILLKEEWRDQAALDAHMQTSHFLAFKRALEAAIGREMEAASEIWRGQPLDM